MPSFSAKRDNLILAMAALHGIEEKFGIMVPQFEPLDLGLCFLYFTVDGTAEALFLPGVQSTC